MSDLSVDVIIVSRIDRLEDRIGEKLDHLLALVNNHESRLTALEAIEVKKLSERVQTLEHDKAHLKGISVGVAAVAALGGGTIATVVGNLIK